MPKMSVVAYLADPSAADNVLLWLSNADDWRRTSLTDLATALQPLLNLPQQYPEFVTQYAQPSVSPMSLSVTTGDDNIYLLITPTVTIAVATISMPAAATCRDHQEVLVHTTRQLTSLTVDPNGALGVDGAPTTLAAGSFFRMRYDAPMNSWHRVG